MEKALFDKIWNRLDSEGEIARTKGTAVSKETLWMIHVQKKVQDMRGGRFYKVKARAADFLDDFQKGRSLVDIARAERFPPVLMASFIMEEAGEGKKRIKKMIKNPAMIQDPRLRTEVEKAVEADYLYSPWVHALQVERAKAGEGIIRKWLEEKGMDFIEEADMSTSGKTPDFVIQSDLMVEGQSIRWIESKAGFGSPAEHQRYMKKQISHYRRELGRGMVVYWFGFVDGIEVDDGIMVKDSRFFHALVEDIDKLFSLARRRP